MRTSTKIIDKFNSSVNSLITEITSAVDKTQSTLDNSKTIENSMEDVISIAGQVQDLIQQTNTILTDLN